MISSDRRLRAPLIHLLIGIMLMVPFAAPFATPSSLPAPIEAALVAAPAHAQSPTIYYVDITRPDDSGNGLSWATAKRNLQSALALAGSGAQIWVADGIYYPDEGTGQTDDDRTSTFSLKDGVKIYGGFAGGETSLSQRNPATNVAILSGDLQQNDSQQPIITNIATVTGIGDNAYHVVSSNGNPTTTLLDGFTITAGNANGSVFPSNVGGGVYTFSTSQAQFTNLTITGNTAKFGGGVFTYQSNATFTDVTISNNTASTDKGGGVYNFSSNATFTNVTITGNTAPSTAEGSGGGVYNRSLSPSFTNVTISNNTVGKDGGGIFNYQNSTPQFSNVTVSHNPLSLPV